MSNLRHIANGVHSNAPASKRRATYERNEKIIWETVKANPELNVTQIAKITHLQRRIVRKHLNHIRERGEIDKIGAGYVLVPPISIELNDLTHKTLATNSCEDWNPIFPHNVAGAYVFSEPDKSHNLYRYLFDPIVETFFKDGFWIDNILAYAISWRRLRKNVVSKGLQPEMNVKLLKRGWRACFGDSKLFIVAFAFSPPHFLDYLTTPAGQKWLTRHLTSNWNSVLGQVKKQRLEFKELRALAKQHKKQIPQNGARFQMRAKEAREWMKSIQPSVEENRRVET
jgi:hypothetical protein